VKRRERTGATEKDQMVMDVERMEALLAAAFAVDITVGLVQ